MSQGNHLFTRTDSEKTDLLVWETYEGSLSPYIYVFFLLFISFDFERELGDSWL